MIEQLSGIRTRREALVVAAIALVVSICPATTHAQSEAAPPERRVEDNRLVSEDAPALDIHVTEEARYLGARRIVIEDRFVAELHVFAEADAHGLVERFYWFQFESYLPDAPGRYDYRQSNPETVLFDGIEMHMRPGGENTTEGTIRPGSDYEAFVGLIDAAGLRLPNWLSTLRLVHLFEETERQEFIIFYGEGPDALAEAAAEAMIAGEPGLVFADMLPDLIADVDARIDLVRRD